MEKVKRYDVALCCDTEWMPHAGVTLYSLLKNHAHLAFRVHFLNKEFCESSWEKMEEIARPFDCELKKHIIDSTLFQTAVKNKENNLPIQTYYRLFLHERIEGDRVLYLDADMVVDADITELLEVDLGENYCAAVRDIFQPTFILSLQEKGGRKLKDFFNGGVLLLNLEKIRREGRSFLNIENEGKEFLDDQEFLNHIFQDQWISLPSKFNFPISSSFPPICFKTKQRFFRGKKESLPPEVFLPEEAKIYHYTTEIKPWMPFCRSSFLYWKYRKETPFEKPLFSFRNLFADLQKEFPVFKNYVRQYFYFIKEWILRK